MIIDESIFSRLSDEQKKAVEAARSPEELLAVAKETGYELSEEQMSAVAEGSWCGDFCQGYYCPAFRNESDPHGAHALPGICEGLCLTHR